MTKNMRLIVGGISVALFLAMAVGSASANRLSIDNRSIRIFWTGLEFRANSKLVKCGMTLEGSFHGSVITKVAGSLIGYISRAAVGTCAEGTATVLTSTLPWHIQYTSFSGTLPDITSVRVSMLNAAFQFAIPAEGTCLYQSTAARPLIGEMKLESISRTRIEAFVPLATAQVPLRTTVSGSCPAEGTFSGNAAFTGPANTQIHLTLI